MIYKWIYAMIYHRFKERSDDPSFFLHSNFKFNLSWMYSKKDLTRKLCLNPFAHACTFVKFVRLIVNSFWRKVNKHTKVNIH